MRPSPLSDHPIPDSYWVRRGRLLAGEYPGARAAADAQAKLDGLLDAGIRHFVDLTEAGEYNLRPYWPLVQQLAAGRGVAVAHTRLSIPDMGTPTPAHMLQILDTIDAALAEGQGVYVHCFGGIGRTGTVVGCYLVRHGADPAAALAEIARRREGTPDGDRRSPETEAQRQLVLTWQEP
jgi:predicted protein tyrosine phosphatase